MRENLELENSGKVVIDASLATMWAVPETYSDHALHLAGTWAAENIQLLTPFLMLAEVNNAVYRRVARKEMTLTNAKAALEIVLGFPFQLRDSLSVQIRALELANELGRSATYDCQYLALAEIEGCELWTGDRRLCNAIRSKLSWVRWVGEVELSSKTTSDETDTE